MRDHPEHAAALARIKLLHTAVWVFFVACIVLIPVAAFFGEFRWAAACSALVWVECAVLALNRWRCPLTGWAARHTEERAANFDIHLPEWLARRNKEVFGTLFVLGQLFLAWRWSGS